jgi:chromosome segregation ATPase
MNKTDELTKNLTEPDYDTAPLLKELLADVRTLMSYRRQDEAFQDEMRSRLTNLEERQSQLQEGQRQLQERQDKFEQGQTEILTRLSALEMGQYRLKERIYVLNGSILEKRTDEARLHRRVQELEARAVQVS